ncbi:MAG: hypothetical protein QGH21_02785, partial [Candidatus Poseidoniia archaeon]|nr:hypothetical protein [Candidatus Poseidoniia archaeon]
MTNEQQSEWTAQALVAGGAVLLLLAAFWMGVYAPNAKMLPDDFETTYEYEGTLKVLDSGNKTGQGEPGRFQLMQANPDAGQLCFCDSFGEAVLHHTFAADSDQSNDEETFVHEEANVYVNATDSDSDGVPDVFLFSLKDGDSWLERSTYEARDVGGTKDDYAYSTWNPNNLPVKDTTLAPNPFVAGYTNSYSFVGVVDV